MVEHHINSIYNSYEFNMDMVNFDNYEKYLKMYCKIKDIKRRMKIFQLKIYKLDDYYINSLYDPY